MPRVAPSIASCACCRRGEREELLGAIGRVQFKQKTRAGIWGEVGRGKNADDHPTDCHSEPFARGPGPRGKSEETAPPRSRSTIEPVKNDRSPCSPFLICDPPRHEIRCW